MPEGFPHYAKVVCLLCARFLGWVPKPETLERRRFNAFRIARLGMCKGLSAYERRFIEDLSRLKALSPRQQALLERLCKERLEKGGSQ